jgi:hypothetical protein
VCDREKERERERERERGVCCCVGVWGVEWRKNWIHVNEEKQKITQLNFVGYLGGR